MSYRRIVGFRLRFGRVLCKRCFDRWTEKTAWLWPFDKLGELVRRILVSRGMSSMVIPGKNASETKPVYCSWCNRLLYPRAEDSVDFMMREIEEAKGGEKDT